MVGEATLSQSKEDESEIIKQLKEKFYRKQCESTGADSLTKELVIDEHQISRPRRQKYWLKKKECSLLLTPSLVTVLPKKPCCLL